MTTAARPYTATPALPRAVATFADILAGASELRMTLRRARGRTPVPVIEDSDAEGAAKGLLYSDRFKGLEHLITILYDMVDRGTAIEDLDALGETITALIHKYAARQRCIRFDDSRASLMQLHTREEETQGPRELAETKFAHDPTPANARAFLDARRAYVTKDEQLAQYARRVALGGIS